ncbi:LPO_1073/Vpar_1526 family protein [Granulicella paludicola]|uniref:LPO_1073/Vpar_1526 family protein n=1 Tax=Granulicella paludicola TaxID=474951 RepID=UPI0021E03F1B|nr:LPO_1073/Vpar_1526 family protein [Granulicella paludicola]
MANSDQNQKVAAGGLAIQSGGNVTIESGLSYSEVRDIALDTFHANFYKLANKAGEIASARAEEITDQFLEKLQKDNPAGIGESQDPDFQYALLTVQKEYARSGNKELGDLLVELLVDRSKQEKREIIQIVLNEALNTAPKLTESQLAALALVFLFRNTMNHASTNHANFGLYLDDHVLPFIPKIVRSDACYQHIAFTGCASINGLMDNSLSNQIAVTYQGLFCKGFDNSDIPSGLSAIAKKMFFIQCLNDPTKIQVNALNGVSLTAELSTQSIPHEVAAQIKTLFDKNKMSGPEIRTKCESVRPYLKDLFEVWTASIIGKMTLTSVGIAIGHANVQRVLGRKFAELSQWIN